MHVYVTEMLRWGEEESHHYVIGIYSSKEKAEYAGEVEKSWRGGKYEYRVTCHVIDEQMEEEKISNHNDCFVAL